MMYTRDFNVVDLVIDRTESETLKYGNFISCDVVKQRHYTLLMGN